MYLYTWHTNHTNHATQVVYCEADVGTVLGKDGTEEKDRVYDYGLYQKIFKTKSLARIYAETKANRRDPQSPRNIIATTNQHVSDDMAGSPPTGIKPIPDKPGQRMPRTRIAATITFHPLYLDEHRRQNFEHAVMGEDAYTSTEVMTPVRGRSHKLPIEMLRGLSGVLHHEVLRPLTPTSTHLPTPPRVAVLTSPSYLPM